MNTSHTRPRSSASSAAPPTRCSQASPAGSGRYFELNPAVFRLGFVILTLLGGAGILVYLAAVLVVPGRGQGAVDRRPGARRAARPAVAGRRARPRGRRAAAAALARPARRRDRLDRRPRRRPRHPLGEPRPEAGAPPPDRGSTAAHARRASRPCSRSSTAFTWFDVNLGDGVGEHTYAPASAVCGAALLRPRHRQPQDRPLADRRGRHSTASRRGVGIGELKIVVPRDADVRVDAHANVGDVYVLRSARRRPQRERPRGHGHVRDRREGRRRPDRRGARRMTEAPALPFRRSEDDRVLAGRLRRGRVGARRRRDPRAARVRAALARGRRRASCSTSRSGSYGSSRGRWLGLALIALVGDRLPARARALGCGGRSARGCSSPASRVVLARGGSLRPGGSLPVARDRADDGRCGHAARPPRRAPAR